MLDFFRFLWIRCVNLTSLKPLENWSPWLDFFPRRTQAICFVHGFEIKIPIPSTTFFSHPVFSPSFYLQPTQLWRITTTMSKSLAIKIRNPFFLAIFFLTLWSPFFFFSFIISTWDQTINMTKLLWIFYHSSWQTPGKFLQEFVKNFISSWKIKTV
jgi:hypothetical protein